jgi:hypothetical protein
MRGAGEPRVRPVSLDGTGNEHFLFGVDLFNAGYFWEAHASWERLWAVESAPEIRRFLRALVQTTAACLKAAMGENAGARKLLARARVDAPTSFGVDLGALASEALSFVEGGEPPRIEIEIPSR